MTGHTKGLLTAFDEYEVLVDAESNIENQLAGWHVLGNPEVGNGEMFVVLHFHGTPEEEYAANSARLIACWNALAGISDPAAFVEAARGMEAMLMEAIERVEGRDLDQRMCCDGQMCGCRGSTNADHFLHFANQYLTAFRAQIGEA
jgi:hypothetical protein